MVRRKIGRGWELPHALYDWSSVDPANGIVLEQRMSATIAVNVEFVPSGDRRTIWGLNTDQEVVQVHFGIKSLTHDLFDVPDKCRPEHFLYRAANHFGSDGQWRVSTEISSGTSRSLLNPIWFQARPSPTNGQRYIAPGDAAHFIDTGLSYYGKTLSAEKILVSREGLGKPTWLTLAEIRSASSMFELEYAQTSVQLRAVFAAMDALEQGFGIDHVRLIFWHNPE